MAALVTRSLVWKKLGKVWYADPTVVVEASETDLSTPDTSIVINGEGLTKLTLYVKFANYTSVTVKLQESTDGTNYVDISGATTGTTNTFIKLATISNPFIRVSVAATLSASADTLTVTAYAERQA